MNDRKTKLSNEARAMLDAWNGRVCIIPTNVDSELLGVRYANAVANNGESIVVTWEAGRDHRFCRSSGLCLASSDASMADWKIAPWEMHRYNPAIAEERASAMRQADGAKETANSMVAGADTMTKEVAKKVAQDVIMFPDMACPRAHFLVIVPNEVFEAGEREDGPFIKAVLRMVGQSAPVPNPSKPMRLPLLVARGDTSLTGVRVQHVIIVSSTPIQAWNEFQKHIKPRLEPGGMIILMPISMVEKAMEPRTKEDIAVAPKSEVVTNVRVNLDGKELASNIQNETSTPDASTEVEKKNAPNLIMTLVDDFFPTPSEFVKKSSESPCVPQPDTNVPAQLLLQSMIGSLARPSEHVMELLKSSECSLVISVLGGDLENGYKYTVSLVRQESLPSYVKIATLPKIDS